MEKVIKQTAQRKQEKNPFCDAKNTIPWREIFRCFPSRPRQVHKVLDEKKAFEIWN